ncbi:MAG: DUF4367 domain-containing protein [bacterium]
MLCQESQLDELIVEALAEEAGQVAVPQARDIWDKIAGQLLHQEQPQPKGLTGWLIKRVPTRAVAAAALVLAMGVFFFGAAPEAGAFGRRLFSVVVDFFAASTAPQYGDVGISMARRTPPPPDAPPPPPDWPLATGERVVSLDQAREEAAFAFKVPEYLPKGMALDIITVLRPERINQYFRTTDGRRLVIRQDYIPGDFAASSFFSNAKVQKVNIAGAEGTMITQRNPYTGRDSAIIMWFAGDINFRLEGDLSSREALRVARSLK